MDRADGLICDAKQSGDFYVRHRPFKATYFDDFRLREFGVPASLTAGTVPVVDHIFHILCMRLPIQMTGSDAAFMAFAATVTSLMLRRRGRAFHKLADVAARNMIFAVDLKDTITIPGVGVRPLQTLRTIMIKSYFMDKAHRFANECATSKRVAVGVESIVMGFAKALCVMELATILDRAYLEISHLSLRLGSWLERGSSVDALAALADSTRKNSDLPLFGQNL